MTTRFADHLLEGTIAERDALTGMPTGMLFAASDDSRIYQWNGTAWGTWYTPPTVAPGGSGQGAVDFARAKRSSGSITITATASYVNVDTGLDLVLTAAAGDVIEVEPSVGIQAVTTAGYAVIDFVTVVGGAPVNSITTETAAGNSGSHPSWGNANIPTTTPRLNLSGPKRYTLVAGDISAGTVTLRLRIRCGSNMSLLATGDPYLYVQATNLGPQL